MISSQILSALPDAAFRSLALAAAVWIGLRLFRIRSVLALKSAWTFVLAAAFLMPLLLPISLRLPRITVVVPALAQRAAPTWQAVQATAEPAPLAPVTSNFSERSAVPAESRIINDAPPAATTPDHFSVLPVPAAPAPSAPAAARATLTPLQAVALLYLAVAALLLMRLEYGLISAFCLWRTAEPVSAEVLSVAGGLRVRSSSAISSPVTVGSAVILPADYETWESEKLRIVLAHERSHVRQGDFYLQTLAGLYAALIWISPLGWWLKRKLTDLAEAISDRSGLEQAASRSAYAQILFDFAAAPRPTLIGVAMARPSNLSHRIERLFNDRAFRQAFAASRRTLVTAVLVPALMFAAATLVRVEAATQTAQQPVPPSSTSPTTGQSHPDQAQPAAAPDAVQVPPQAEPAPGAAPEPAPAPGAAPVPPAAPAAPTAPTNVEVPPIHVNVPAVHVDVPARHIDVPAVHVNVPERHIDVPAVHVDVPARHIDVPAQHIDVPAVHVDVPAQHIDVPAVHVDQPAKHIDVPAIHIDMPSSDNQGSSGGHAAYGRTGELLAMFTGVGHIFLQREDSAATEATFDRTLTVNGKLDLHVANGSGNIHLTRGSAGQVRIHARVYSNNASEADEVRSIAANPPIQQDGSTIRIGGQRHQGENHNHISIDYEIEAPADAAIQAASGSGNITDEGVGVGARLETGSGNIVATGLESGFIAQTGSGNIHVENAGNGDAKAETGSGNIELKGVNGALKAETGSGDIKAEGTPSGEWKLETGSGSVEFTPGSAPLTLDASAGSGTISSDQPMAMTTSEDHHHVHAALNGGGPEVRIETGSGDIRIK